MRYIQKKKFKATSDSKNALSLAENVLKHELKATTPNQIRPSDITYIPTEEDWLYLAGHRDVFAGKIVGYAMGERIAKRLVSLSLFEAVAGKRPLPA